MLDMWSDVFASAGKAHDGYRGRHICRGAARMDPRPYPRDMRIDAPTPHVWIIGRTQTNGPQDYAAVNKIQDGYSDYTAVAVGPGRSPQRLGHAAPACRCAAHPLRHQVNHMPALTYFK